MNEQNYRRQPEEIPVQPSLGEGGDEVSDNELVEQEPLNPMAAAAGEDLREQMEQAEMQGRTGESNTGEYGRVEP